MKTVINIIGCVRSGTTLLNLIIANDKKAMALGEVYYLFYPNRSKHILLINKLKQDEKWGKIISEGPKRLYANLFLLFPEIDFFVDSSKNSIWYANQMKYNPTYTFRSIAIYKNPMDQKLSLERRNKASIWQRVVKNYYRKAVIFVPKLVTIDLHSLLTQKESLFWVCKYLGIPYSPEKMEYWKNDVKQPNFFGSDTVRKKHIDTNKISRFSLDYKGVDLLSEKLIKIYQHLESNNVTKSKGNYYQWKAKKWERSYLLVRNQASIFKLRVKLYFRDFIFDRSWINE